MRFPTLHARPAVFRVVAVGALFLLSTAAPAAAQRLRRREPRVLIYRSGDRTWRVDLPVAMEDALDRYDRDFEAWNEGDYAAAGLASYDFSPRQTPWAVIGDFNGDGRTDLAIAGRTDRYAVLLFVLSTGRDRFRVVEVQRDPYDRRDPTSIALPILSYRYPGRYVVADPRLPYPREVIVEQPAVQVVGGNREGAVLYAVQANGIVPYYLSDRPAPPAGVGGTQYGPPPGPIPARNAPRTPSGAIPLRP